jgi:hypothetical protein
MSPSRTKATPGRIAIAEREAKALELRKEGATYGAIARSIGYTDRSAAAKPVSRALAATIQEPADELRRLESERLDALLAAVWHDAMAGRRSAVESALRIMDRRSKLIGLDAPLRRAVEVITPEALENVITQLESELADMQGDAARPTA